MESIGDRIRDRRAKLGMSQQALALKVGMGQGNVSDWERGKYTPSRSLLPHLAKALHVSVIWLEFGLQPTESRDSVSQPTRPLTMVPVISWVEAGSFADVTTVYPIENAEDFVPVPEACETCFALIVAGDSCNREFAEGSVIVVNYAKKELVDRKFYVFRNGSGVTLKRYRANPPRLEPYSTNPSHETIYPSAGFEVVGQVKYSVKQH